MSRLKKHVGGLIAFILLLICFSLANVYGETNKNTSLAFVLSLKANPWDGKSAIRFFEEDKEREEPAHLTFWGEEKKQKIEQISLTREVEGQVITIKGDSTLLYPQACNLENNDLKGCLVTRQVAYALFGNTNVIGQEITFGNRTFEIRDVLKEKGSTIIIQADRNTKEVLNRVSMEEKKEIKGKQEIESYANAHGISGEWINFSIFSTLGRGVLLLLPLCMGVDLFIPFLRNMSRYKNTPIKLLIYSFLLLSFFILFLKVSGVGFRYPLDMVPPKWSDFGFWSELYKQKVRDITMVLEIEKTQVDRMVIIPFMQAVKYMVSCIALYFLFVRKIKIQRFSVLFVYLCVSMTTVFWVLKVQGIVVSPLIHQYRIWFLPFLYFGGKMVQYEMEHQEES